MLIDGSLQFGDLRALLKVPVDAPSILDLPTDRVSESDLQDVLWRDPSGIDILLAPPRIEMAEMVTIRDIDKVLSLLRRVYGSSSSTWRRCSTTSTSRSSTRRDTILEIVTYDSTTIRNTVAMAEAFQKIGYPPTKVRYLVNRADSSGGIDPDELAGRSAVCPSTASSPTAMSSSSEQRGRALRARRPGAPDQPGRASPRELLAVARHRPRRPRRRR